MLTIIKIFLICSLLIFSVITNANSSLLDLLTETTRLQKIVSNPDHGALSNLAILYPNTPLLQNSFELNASPLFRNLDNLLPYLNLSENAFVLHSNKPGNTQIIVTTAVPSSQIHSPELRPLNVDFGDGNINFDVELLFLLVTSDGITFPDSLFASLDTAVRKGIKSTSEIMVNILPKKQKPRIFVSSYHQAPNSKYVGVSLGSILKSPDENAESFINNLIIDVFRVLN